MAASATADKPMDVYALRKSVLDSEAASKHNETLQNIREIYSKYTHKIKPYPDFFRDVSCIYRIWVNGLDWNRFCAPDRTIEKSNSFFFDFLSFSAKACVEYWRSEA